MIKVLLFGALAEAAGAKEVHATAAKNLKSLLDELNAAFPKLSDFKYKVSVDKKLVTDTTMAIPEGAEVGLLPPFSGG